MAKLFTLQESLEYGRKNKIEKWIHSFLQGPGKNKPFSDGLKLYKRYYTKPVLFDLNKLTRICGPEKDMKYVVSKSGFEKNVKNMMKSIEDGWDIPPLIVNYSRGKYELNDGNHRFEALIRSGIFSYYVIFWTTDFKDYEEILKYENAKDIF